MDYSKIALALIASFSFAQLSVENTALAAPNAKALAKLKKSFKTRGLVRLPEAEDSVATRSSRRLGSLAVSGEAPALVDLPNSDIANLFWRPGVVNAIASGNATQEQCNEFFSGNEDGASGGFGACFLAESVGRGLQQLGEGGASLCYMKNFPTEANLEAGGVTLDDGEFPGGDITKIFATPSGSKARLVRVHVTGAPQGDQGGGGQNDDGPGAQANAENDQTEDVNIRVYPTSDKFLYRVDLWFCKDGQVSGRDAIAIKSDGTFSAANFNRAQGQEGAYSSRTLAKLTFKGGVPAFDLGTPRKIRSEFRQGDNAFKSQVVVKGSTIETRTLDMFGSQSRKSNMITRFSGSAPEEIRFLDGAFAVVQEQGGNFQGNIEFRDSYYAAAEESDLASKLDSLDEVAEDSFFEELPEEDYDLSNLSCDGAVDVELSLDMNDATVQESVRECEERAFRDMRFCFENEQIRAAQENYFTACMPQNPGPGGGGNGPQN
jgi:hypothetical protein